MKIRVIALGCLVGAIVLFMGHEYSQAGSEVDNPSLRVGVISVWKIFQDCKRVAKYRKEAVAERDQIMAELNKLSKEIGAEEAGLKTLKAGSSDHTSLMREILEKRAKFRAQEEFHKRQTALKDQKMTEELYKDILLEIRKVAERKGLDLVFERTEPELPAASASELTLAISTHKLLYNSKGCLDITDEVMSRLDAKK